MSRGDVVRIMLLCPLNDPVGVMGATKLSSETSSSNSAGGERSTSGEGESSRRRESSVESDREGAEEREGEIIARDGGYEAEPVVKGSGIGWCGQVVR
jgi:hypothetical protein